MVWLKAPVLGQALDVSARKLCTIRGARDDGGLLLYFQHHQLPSKYSIISCEVVEESFLGETAILPAASLGLKIRRFWGQMHATIGHLGRRLGGTL